MGDLMPCPFCGSEKVQTGGDDKVVGVWCHNCGATGPNGYLTINGEHDWNNRAAPNVKPLDWQHFDAWTWWAETPVGIYRANEREGKWRVSYGPLGTSECKYLNDDEYDNTEAAVKAGAQDHFDAMILEALQ